MKATDLIQLLEYGKAFKAPKAERSRAKKKDFDISEIDISLLIHKKLQEADVLKKLLDDRERANKKEEKKEEKKGLSIHHVSTFLMLTFPITAPLYVFLVKHLLT